MTNKWNNDPLIVYHGSDTFALSAYKLRLGKKITKFEVALEKCSPFTDFGRGFYVTTSIIQARNWANDRVRKRDQSIKSRAALLSFEIDRNWLSKLETLAFVLPDKNYWEIVEYSRQGNAPHNRQILTSSCKQHFEVIFAPVSLWPQNMTIGNADQISFHSAEACKGLAPPRLRELGSEGNPFLGGTVI